MFICVCNAIRDTDLRATARQCAGGVDAVYACMGKAPQCGQCLDEAAEILIEERELARAEQLTPA
ncbi:bacterioferritin-associated ferredoxin [Novosphingobium sp.]|uniref:(2Fe-2S)-binding protein n=1 Tax=Novosphingobium sp. TaxID=1874826 RepID=UPI00273385EF|nr:(2Fe-2S)-binding protein [Novosphingobium sp.]MDP3908371.1 (2Fe-2S)-binding protein [Novosphingobium sp.]